MKISYLSRRDDILCTFKLRREQEGRAESDSGQTLKERKDPFGLRRQPEGAWKDVAFARLLRGQGREDGSRLGLRTAEEDLEFWLEKMKFLELVIQKCKLS